MKRTRLSRKTPLRSAGVRRARTRPAGLVARGSSRTPRLKKRGRKRPLQKILDDRLRQIVLQRDVVCQMSEHPEWGPCGGALCVSHVLPKGKYPALRFRLENVKLLCWVHHDVHSPRSWHSNPLQATDWFRRKFPLRAALLQELSQETLKVDRKSDAEYLDSHSETR